MAIEAAVVAVCLCCSFRHVGVIGSTERKATMGRWKRLSNNSPVVLVVMVLLTGLLLAATVAATPCNKHRPQGNAVPCDRDFPAGLFCDSRDQATCTASLGAGRAWDIVRNRWIPGTDWQRQCDNVAHEDWDHCVVTGGDCRQKYTCTWDLTKQPPCTTGIAQGTYFQEDWAASPSCDPTAS